MILYHDKEIRLAVLQNANGTRVEITNFGARIVRLIFKGTDVVQGFDNLEDYFPENNKSDFGAVIGRYANRIKNGLVSIGDRLVQLPRNNGPNCLHGGPMGWQYAAYDIVEHDCRHLLMTMVSPDGDNGFPGTVKVSVEYSLDDNDALSIRYAASSDADTVINMTNHSYFNLSGDLGSPIAAHRLWIDASKFTPTDETAIPTGSHLAVDDTPMDFRTMKEIGRDIDADFEQLKLGHGYDHNWVLDTHGSVDKPCAILESPSNGIGMEVYTSQPGIQVYTGNFLDGIKGKEGKKYAWRSAVCLETQQYPDSPNNLWPESTGRLKADDRFEALTIYRFYESGKD